MKLPNIRGSYTFNVVLANYTWLKVGGKADVLFEPADLEDLQYFIKNLSQDISWTIIGKASNILIRDGGVKGVVIKLTHDFGKIHIHNNQLIVGAWAFDSTVAQKALYAGLSGLEFLCGIPGSIGGSVVMNAGAYGTSMQDIIQSITILNEKGELYTIQKKNLHFQYRSCAIPPKSIVISVCLQGQTQEPAIIKDTMIKIRTNRRNTQPIKEKTGGSTFINPIPYKAWELLNACGLRGAQHGNAQFSNKHCNFLINKGNATAKDLETLGEIARQKVFERFGIHLQWEIKRIGYKP